MKDKDLINKGFYQYSPTPFDNGNIEICFQKRYEDNIGKKYFINIKKWGSWRHPHTGEFVPAAYEYNIQLYKKEGHDAIDLLFHDSWNLEEVEKYLDKLWNTDLFDYYEKFEV